MDVNVSTKGSKFAHEQNSSDETMCKPGSQDGDRTVMDTRGTGSEMPGGKEDQNVTEENVHETISTESSLEHDVNELDRVVGDIDDEIDGDKHEAMVAQKNIDSVDCVIK